tara:strand:+ start:1865 stop:2023 length:159 start_codon:yes stop_codon:yes gene_type:complete
MFAWIILTLYFLYVLMNTRETYEILITDKEDGKKYRVTVGNDGKFLDRKEVT